MCVQKHRKDLARDHSPAGSGRAIRCEGCSRRFLLKIKASNTLDQYCSATIFHGAQAVPRDGKRPLVFCRA